MIGATGVAPSPCSAARNCLVCEIRLRRHAGEHDLLPIIVAELSKANLERTPLIQTSGASRGRRGFHSLGLGEQQKLRQERPRSAGRYQRSHLRDSPLVLRRASVPHDLGNLVERPPAGHPTAIPGALPFNRMMRCYRNRSYKYLIWRYILVVVRKFGLNEVDQQRKKPMLALLQRQPDHPRRIPPRSRDRPPYEGQRSHPVRPTPTRSATSSRPPATMTGLSHSAPTF